MVGIISHNLYPARGRKLCLGIKYRVSSTRFISHNLYPARGRKRLLDANFKNICCRISHNLYPARGRKPTIKAIDFNDPDLLATTFTPQGDGNFLHTVRTRYTNTGLATTFTPQGDGNQKISSTVSFLRTDQLATTFTPQGDGNDVKSSAHSS